MTGKFSANVTNSRDTYFFNRIKQPTRTDRRKKKLTKAKIDPVHELNIKFPQFRD